ncbi:MAG: HAMP domain-containing histidine kinase [Prevotella sp.]|nr:HAMP domain-containing histidine kinase [Prevotella sp.]
MNSYIKTKTTLLLALLLFGLATAFAEEQEDPEETRLREEMYKYFDTSDRLAFEDAVHQLRSYYKTMGKWHEMYTAWENEIVYDINNDHFYSALKKTEAMNDFIMSNNHMDEFYRMDYLMGMFYGTRNNIAMCKKYLDQALEKLKGRKEYRAEASNIYMLLANILAFDNPDSATISIDKCIALCEDNRDLSAALQMKCIIEFGKKDRTGFIKAYNKNSQIKLSDPKEYNPSYEDYVEQGMASFEGRFDDALEINGKMNNRLDQLLFLTKIYDMKGDRAAEAEALKTLLKAREKWYSEISSMEINDISNDINLEQMRREKDKAYDLMTYIALGACVLGVLFLSYFIWSRRRHMRELMEQNHQLILARDHAQEADRMKTAFIQNVSHQIRTPLNAVSGFSTILANQIDELADDERQDLARRIEHSATIITNSLNHLITLSDVDSINMNNNSEPINCHDFCREIVKEFKPMKQTLGFSYSSSIGQDVTVKSNRSLLKSVILEILMNADKFTDEGGITLSSDMKDGMWLLSVTDTGTGIPEGDEERIFGHFTKIDDFSEGLGLGLTFCKNIALRLGGDIVLDKDYHDGARFIVKIPA